MCSIEQAPGQRGAHHGDPAYRKGYLTLVIWATIGFFNIYITILIISTPEQERYLQESFLLHF